MADLCGVPNPDVPSTVCDLPAGHGRTKKLWIFGAWMDHMATVDGQVVGWVIPPTDERDQALVEAFAGAMAESMDFLDLLVRGLDANGFVVRQLPKSEGATAAHQR